MLLEWWKPVGSEQSGEGAAGAKMAMMAHWPEPGFSAGPAAAAAPGCQWEVGLKTFLVNTPFTTFCNSIFVNRSFARLTSAKCMNFSKV